MVRVSEYHFGWFASLSRLKAFNSRVVVTPNTPLPNVDTLDINLDMNDTGQTSLRDHVDPIIVQDDDGFVDITSWTWVTLTKSTYEFLLVG